MNTWKVNLGKTICKVYKISNHISVNKSFKRNKHKNKNILYKGGD